MKVYGNIQSQPMRLVDTGIPAGVGFLATLI